MQSMTGFAHATLLLSSGQYTLEIRSLNHRYLDLGFNLPERWRKLESEFRHAIRQHCHRGKIDVSLKLQAANSSNALVLNKDFLLRLKEATATINNIWHQQEPISPLDALNFPGVMQQSQNEEDEYPKLKEFFEHTFGTLLANRATEGQYLQTHLATLITKLKTLIDEIASQQPLAAQRLREKLSQKIQDVITTCDPLRLEQELAFLATRYDIEEEMSRLFGHIKQFAQVIQQSGPVGKQLEFLLQELAREVNTLGSKTQDLPITYQALTAKLLVEQMREQVQNVE